MSAPAKPAAPVRSMTGFAQVRKHTAAGELMVSLRSVNHRGLDLHFHQASEFAALEAPMRALLKEHVGRGHIEVRASLSPAMDEREAGPSFNHAVLQSYLEAFRKACVEFELESRPDLNALLTLPGVLSKANEEKPLDEEFQREFIELFEVCIKALNECREREGYELAASLLREVSEIEQATQQLLALRVQALPYLHQRLREKLGELLNGTFISEGRLAEETALLADRSDVQEELTRLTVHIQELRRLVEAGGAIGKPLDFLLQEMNRETNTTLSKNSGAGGPGLRMTNLGLAVKANIERIREQALNLE